MGCVCAHKEDEVFFSLQVFVRQLENRISKYQALLLNGPRETGPEGVFSTPKVHSRHIACVALSSCRFLSHAAPRLTGGLPLPLQQLKCGQTRGLLSL